MMVGSKSTMFLFIIRPFLLLTFLLQATEARNEQTSQTTPNADGSAQYQEFCLHIPENSHWTSSEPGTQLPTESVNPTKQTTKSKGQKPSFPKQPAEAESDNEESSEMIRPEVERTNMRPIFAAPLSNPLGPTEELNGCRCNKEKRKQPTERSRVTGLTVWYPSETCSSIEHIETLEDGREVCTTPFSLLTYFVQSTFVSGPNQGSIGAHLVSSTAPPDSSTTESVLTTQPETSTHVEKTVLKPFTVEQISRCESCSSQTNLDDVDPTAVQSLNVEIQPSPCPALISINLKDETVFCSNLFHLNVLLQKLEIPPPQEENVVPGCRCYERAKKLPAEASPVKETTIWLPGDNCSSTEFIERLKDGREVCVTGTNITTFIKTLQEHHGGEATMSKILQEGAREGVIVQLRPLVMPSAVLLGREEFLVELPRICRLCTPHEMWNSIQPKDIKSINMHLGFSACPATFIRVALTDGRNLCMDSTWPQFKELLEKFGF